MISHPQERFVPKEWSLMRKHVASLFATAALGGAALPVATAMPASAAALSCQPVSHSCTVSQEKVAVHATPSPRGSVVGYKGSGERVGAQLDPLILACSWTKAPRGARPRLLSRQPDSRLLDLPGLLDQRQLPFVGRGYVDAHLLRDRPADDRHLIAEFHEGCLIGVQLRDQSVRRTGGEEMGHLAEAEVVRQVIPALHNRVQPVHKTGAVRQVGCDLMDVLVDARLRCLLPRVTGQLMAFFLGRSEWWWAIAFT